MLEKLRNGDAAMTKDQLQAKIFNYDSKKIIRMLASIERAANDKSLSRLQQQKLIDFKSLVDNVSIETIA